MATAKPNEFAISIEKNATGSIPKPYITSANPNAHRLNLDLVRWENDTDHEFRLTFKNNDWPFEGPPCVIVVPAMTASVKGVTGWYRLRNVDPEHGKHLEFYYTADVGLAGPPGDPMVGVDD